MSWVVLVPWCWYSIWLPFGLSALRTMVSDVFSKVLLEILHQKQREVSL